MEKELREENERLGRALINAIDAIDDLQGKEKWAEQAAKFAVEWFKNCPVGGDIQSVEQAKEYYNQTYKP